MLKQLLLFALCGALTLAAVACDEEAPAPTTQPSQTEESYTISYVPNETINRFILTFKERSELQIQDIAQGNSPNEYTMVLTSCQVTLSASANGMGVMIQSQPGETGQKNLFAAFTHIAKAADKSCTKTHLDNAIAFMKQQTSSSESYRVCNEVKILSYLPSVQVGGSATPHRLDLVLLNYVDRPAKN